MIVVLLAAAALNQAVTQDTVTTTICQPGFSSTYRRHHPVRIPSRKGWVRDHRVPLSLGGSSDPANIQWQSKADAARKDVLERRLSRAVCRGSVSLRDAQLRMEEWR